MGKLETNILKSLNLIEVLSNYCTENFRHVTVAGVQLPLKNSSQCTADVWKSVACALHVKPCTAKVSDAYYICR